MPALTHMPDSTYVSKFQSIGALSYYRLFLKKLTTNVRPLNAPLKQGAEFKYITDEVGMV